MPISTELLLPIRQEEELDVHIIAADENSGGSDVGFEELSGEEDDFWDRVRGISCLISMFCAPIIATYTSTSHKNSELEVLLWLLFRSSIVFSILVLVADYLSIERASSSPITYACSVYFRGLKVTILFMAAVALNAGFREVAFLAASRLDAKFVTWILLCVQIGICILMGLLLFRSTHYGKMACYFSAGFGLHGLATLCGLVFPFLILSGLMLGILGAVLSARICDIDREQGEQQS